MAKTLLTKDQFEELADKLGVGEDELRPDYSGRGMYGATCLGWDDNNRTGPAPFQLALAEILAPSLLFLDEDEEPDVDDIKEAVEQLGGPSSDGMGLGTIYYYRGIQVEGYAQGSRF